MPWGIIVAAVVLVIFILPNIRVVSQSNMYIIERLGKYKKTWTAGLHVKVPFIDRIANKVTSKEMLLDFPKQRVITKDNVAMEIDTVVFAKIKDPKLYTYAVEHPRESLENLTATNLRNLVGSMDLDETLTSRDKINVGMEKNLDAATNNWGLDVTRVEVRDILPPSDILDAMTKQMKAERDKRAGVLEAEAHKLAIVTRAEGDKAAQILAAEAQSESQIALARGKAESIRLVYEAEAKGIEMLNAANMSESVLKLKSIDALKEVANGNATKIFMPTDISSLVSTLGIVGESLGIGDSTAIKSKAEAPKPDNNDPCLSRAVTETSFETSAANAEFREEAARVSDTLDSNQFEISPSVNASGYPIRSSHPAQGNIYPR